MSATRAQPRRARGGARVYAPLLGVAVGGDVAVVETDDEEEDEDEDTGLIHLVVIKPGTTVPRLVDTVEVLV
jgi:hypothetical protein